MSKRKVNLYLKANNKTAYPEQLSKPGNSFRLVKENNIEFIQNWSVSGLAEPTAEQLTTYESSAQTEENNSVIIANRKSEYGTTEHQIENIIENGLEAEQTRVQAIKEKYPKE